MEGRQRRGTTHFGERLSPKKTSTVAKEGGISDISNAALYHQVKNSGEWLCWICEAKSVQLVRSAGLDCGEQIELADVAGSAVFGKRIVRIVGPVRIGTAKVAIAC